MALVTSGKYVTLSRHCCDQLISVSNLQKHVMKRLSISGKYIAGKVVNYNITSGVVWYLKLTFMLMQLNPTPTSSSCIPYFA